MLLPVVAERLAHVLFNGHSVLSKGSRKHVNRQNLRDRNSLIYFTVCITVYHKFSSFVFIFIVLMKIFMTLPKYFGTVRRIIDSFIDETILLYIVMCYFIYILAYCLHFNKHIFIYY